MVNFACIASVLPLTLASRSQINAKLEQAISAAMPGQARSISPFFQNMAGNYGCWCSTTPGGGHGRSQPKDALDGHCKALQQNYECIPMDTDPTCVPWEVSFTAYTPTMPASGSVAIKAFCDAQEVSDCAKQACHAEGHYTESVFNLFMDATMQGTTMQNPLFIHGSAFDYDAECPIVPGPASDKSCCGELPMRFPFRTVSNTRGCCGGITFDATTMMCCDASTEVIGMIGTC
jgi:hypothetical protein